MEATRCPHCGGEDDGEGGPCGSCRLIANVARAVVAGVLVKVGMDILDEMFPGRTGAQVLSLVPNPDGR